MIMNRMQRNMLFSNLQFKQAAKGVSPLLVILIISVAPPAFGQDNPAQGISLRASSGTVTEAGNYHFTEDVSNGTLSMPVFGSAPVRPETNSLQNNRSRTIPELDQCPAMDCHGHNHDSHDGYTIHFTDYLYRDPEIRKAYEQWLYTRRHYPDELLVMDEPPHYEVGDTLSFMVYNIEKSETSGVYDKILFELRALGEASEIWVQQTEYKPDKVSDQVVTAMMEALEERTPPLSINPEQGIILNNIEYFAEGDPSKVPDPDGTGRVKILVVDIQDGWTEESGGGYVAGFFNPLDLAGKTANRNSNEAAILYINSMPGIYIGDRQRPMTQWPLNTIAHEFQHLIQAGRGNLITFMDEGQSELAEVLNGYRARTMRFLSDPEELAGLTSLGERDGFFRWRHSTEEVLRDYERAQLFHSYLLQRVGAEAIGSLTQSSSGSPWVQYQRILDKTGEDLNFRTVLSDFYVAGWLNNADLDPGYFGFTVPQVTGARIDRPSRRYSTEDRPWVRDQKASLSYGGANLTEWQEVKDLTLNLDTSPGFIHYLITETGEREVEVNPVDEDFLFLEGHYRSAVLASVNTVVQTTANYGYREFRYTAEWEPGGLRLQQIEYARAPVAGFFPVPSESTNPAAPGTFKGFSVRLDSPEGGRFDGAVVILNSSNEAVVGQGTLQVSLTTSRLHSGMGAETLYVPDEVLAEVNVDFSNLRPGNNEIDFSRFGVELDPDLNYHLFFRVENPSQDAQLQFLLDEGSNDTADKNYYPVRTILAQEHEGQLGWRYFVGDPANPQDNPHKNLLAAFNVLVPVDVDTGWPEMAVSDRFELLGNYPNPFNSGTNIQFNIPDSIEEEVPVRLDIYDITGRLVATAVNDWRSAGVHTVAFDARQMASGIYLKRLRAGDTSDTRKMTLIR